ncbi:HEPN domain-containing protein/predicted nucleotidyltransferase [Rhabdobacter roseus]|uniref:HEPN domain-containing protein/predicted nucleotidyltransferase n=1 Tax=Rhabdobacter roseus TaxID=1655419 RepID=A0A840THM4_9BACT|nr:HEPN domain-containing protein [Rhabdobacter roseus]MBB5282964.1 HEPN domain-containing protein/predicted nucleotidyltransferase [Rhabdobacter roseus]
MKTTLDHLPSDKQREILEILEIIKEEANPEKIILFGSYAKGDWVEDKYREDGVTYTYISDYDFLVVIKKNGIKEQAIISHIENRCEGYKNVVSPIVHDIDYINEGLLIGQYFFTEIINDGILLFDSGNFQLARAKTLTVEEEKSKAKGYFDMWFPMGLEFLKLAENKLGQENLRIGAFMMHQAAEYFYSAALLVHTGYKPKTHNLHKLRNYSKHLSTNLYSIFRSPVSDTNELRLFDLLKKGYIDARYKLDYLITESEYSALLEKLKRMKVVVEELCEQRIASFV